MNIITDNPAMSMLALLYVVAVILFVIAVKRWTRLGRFIFYLFNYLIIVKKH